MTKTSFPPFFVSASLSVALASASCSEQHAAPKATGAAPSASAVSSADSLRAASPPLDAGPPAYAGPWLGATALAVPVWSEMDWPGDRKGDRDTKSSRLGSLRYGERVPVIAEPHKKANCPEGWYELLAGGFVCAKNATLDLDHPGFKQTRAADLEGPLPYVYGANYSNGTPLYRRVPSREDRKRFEPWLFRPRKPKPTDEENPYLLGGMRNAMDAGAESDDPDADVPWWEKEEPDGAPPQVTLEDLEERGGPMARRMVKGFFLSLDHDLEAGGAKWWKTINGLTAPFDRILVTKQVTEYHGVWLGKDDGTYATKNVPARRIDKLPVGFILNRYAKRWAMDEDHKHVSVADGALDRYDAVGLTGEKARIAGIEYWETDAGWWLRAIDGTRTEPGNPPERLGEHDKWIDVNLKRQTLVAFEGTAPVFATIFSSGRNEHETPPGSFRIREKHISATMDGDAELATDGPYSIEDVPYIQYFNAGYAFHGAFWHSSFGSVKSHGCVNLAPWDAKALFGWTDPVLPEGWHAVVATKDKPGTKVIVRDRAPGTCTGPNAQPPQCIP